MTEKLQQIILDPAEVAYSGRTEVALMGSGLEVAKDGLDFGDAEFKQFLAEGEYGSRPIDGIWPSVTVKIPLILSAAGGVSFDDWRVKLEHKVVDFNLGGGGQIKRVLPSGRYAYADITGAKLHLGAGWSAENIDFDREALLELQRLPDWYGDEVGGEVHEFTGDGSFTEIIGGTLPARVDSLIVTDASGHDQFALPWSVRSRNYDSAPSAAWAYEAEELTPLDAAAEAELTGASGGKAVKHGSISAEWTPVLSTFLRSGSYLSHQGVYDVWARVYTTNATPPWLRLLWSVSDSVNPDENSQVQVPGAGAFYLVNLGQVNLGATHFGEQRWEGVIQARGAGGENENLYIDRLYLHCADECSGVPSSTPTFQAPLTGYKARDSFNQAEHTLNEQLLNGTGVASGPKSPGTVEDNSGTGTFAWSNPSNAKASDNTYAEVTLSTFGQQSHYLKATEFGFSIPEAATIIGISVAVERRGNQSGASGGIYDTAAFIVKEGSVGTVNKRFGVKKWETVDTTAVYGGSTDLWGTTWTPAQINATNFGFALAVGYGGGPDIYTARVDAITITVYYTEGGTLKWATSGDAVDLKIIESVHRVKREEVSDASINQGRYALAGSSKYTTILAGIECSREASAAAAGEEIRQGVLLRYVDESNWLMGCFDFVNASGSGEDSIRILKRKAGVVTELFKASISASAGWRRLWIEADTHGRVMLWAALTEGSSPELVAVVFDSDLATGGTLETGKVGFYDAKIGSKANARWYDNFLAWVPMHDAVIFSGQSARLTTDGMFRMSSDGKSSGRIARPGADLPRLPVSGPAEQPVEIALKVSRGDSGQLPDTGLDTFTAQLVYRPCYGEIPEA